MKKIFEQAGKLLDYLSKNINRLKTVGKILGLFVFIMSLGGNGCQHNKAIDLAEKLTGLDIKNALLKKDNEKKDVIIEADSLEIIRLNIVIDGLENKADVLESEGVILRADLTNLKDSIINIPADSSYAFLQAQAYPYPGELKYPFNEPQIRNIHLDFLENRNLWGVNNNLKLQVNNCQSLIAANYERSAKYSNQLNKLKFQKTNQDEIIKNKDTEIDLLKGNVKKEKRGKGFWKVVSAALGGLAILIAL